MDDYLKKIISKIEKCLALAKSANEHEAAVALGQARKLMQAHNVDYIDIAVAKVAEAETHKVAETMPDWQWSFAHLIADAFNSKMYQGWHNGAPCIKFYGLANNALFASYAFEALLPRLKKARREYMATELRRVRVRANKTYRADQFCKGWVSTMRRKIDQLGFSPEEAQVLDDYKEKRLNLSTGKALVAKPKTSGLKRDDGDFVKGRAAGSSIDLYMPVNQEAELALLAG